MDLNVSNVSFGKSTRNWSTRGAKAPDKKAMLDKLSRMSEEALLLKRSKAEQFEVALRNTTKNLTHEFQGLSLNDIVKIMSQY